MPEEHAMGLLLQASAWEGAGWQLGGGGGGWETAEAFPVEKTSSG